MYGDDYEYANSRLAGTVVRVGEEPVMVDVIRPDLIAEVSFLENFGDVVEVKLSELNLTPVPLGMCNTFRTVSYLSRLPMRRDWKQGLRKSNFICAYTGQPELIKPADLCTVIKGQYPTLKECYDKVAIKADGKQSLAWHRHWAVSSERVIYKTFGFVGTIDRDLNITLNKEFEYLYQALEESICKP